MLMDQKNRVRNPNVIIHSKDSQSQVDEKSIGL